MCHSVVRGAVPLAEALRFLARGARDVVFAQRVTQFSLDLIPCLRSGIRVKSQTAHHFVPVFIDDLVFD